MTVSSFTPDSIVRTILGWTPGLRTLVGGRVLPCGCLAGTYHTWGSQVVVILDAKDEACDDARHRHNAVLWASTSLALLASSDYDEASPGPGLA
jgi:hypothetical protein